MAYNYGGNEAFGQLIALIKQALNTKEDIFKVSSLSEATAADVGKIVLYSGATEGGYVNGDLYIGKSNGEDPATYSWEKLSYNKSEVDGLIAAAGHFEAVATLPTENIKTNVIYLVPKAPVVGKIYGYQATDPANSDVYVANGSTYDKYSYDNEGSIFKFVETVASATVDVTDMVLVTVNAELKDTQNVKDEYINLDGTTAGWELIGSTAIDLSNYVQRDEMIAITAAQITSLWENTPAAQ
jgi:hypothetical protein